MAPPIRVLVVDDSAFARKVVREVLQAAGMEVVGIARDGLEALEQIATLKPDVVSLDLVMPNLDGNGVLQALSALQDGSAPRVVVVSMSNEDSAIGAEALQHGAISIVRKPTALATDQLYELKDALVKAVREAAAAKVVLPRPVSLPAPRTRSTHRHSLVVIGTSTGGPNALTQLLAAIPADFPAPIAIVLHIPAGYTAELAKRLDRGSTITVVEAEEGLQLQPGVAVLAPGGLHMTVANTAGVMRVQLASAPFHEPHKPSVDVLFESAAKHAGAGVLGVVLTGMGSDGLRGARAIVAAGGEVLTEAEASCVVYGMPSVVKEAGLSSSEAPLEDMARLINERL